MKTFTAKQLNNNPAPVFAAAYKDGKTTITNNNYTGLGVKFVLVAEEKDNLCVIGESTVEVSGESAFERVKPCSTD